MNRSESFTSQAAGPEERDQNAFRLRAARLHKINLALAYTLLLIWIFAPGF